MGVMVARARRRLAFGGGFEGRPGATVIRFALAPRWWAWHLALVAVLVAFGWLGWWQVQSFEDSGARPQASQRAAAVAVDSVTRAGGRLEADDIGRRVRATGTWDADGQLLVPDRTHGGRTGSLVVTPLRTTQGVLPVVRGWVSGGSAPVPADGEVTVTGVVQQSETEGDATVAPAGLPPGEVAYVATVTLLERLPYDADELYDGYVVLRSQDPADPGAPARVAADGREGSGDGVGRWRNLAYGLQWWLFAAAAVFFWGAVIRRAALESRPGPGSQPGAPPPSLAAPRRRT
jgi:cytochrome oxidase assembly protein ShyY1